jgi:hypothetical protein
MLIGGRHALVPDLRPNRSRIAILDTDHYSDDLDELVYDGLRLFNLDVRAKSILLKPNIIEYIRGKPVNTDPQLVGATAEAFLRLDAASVSRWAGAGSKMYFDVRDLDQFVEINKEYGYEELDGKKRINVRNSDDVTELLRRNYMSERGRTKAQLIPELPSTMEDLLKLVLRSKSIVKGAATASAATANR